MWPAQRVGIFSWMCSKERPRRGRSSHPIPRSGLPGYPGHFTARQERKQRGDTYWYAYLKARRHRLKRYLGTTGKLTLSYLEQTASRLNEDALGTLLQGEHHNARPPKVTPQGLRVGPLMVLWHEDVLSVNTPAERHILNRTETADLLSYLYDRRSSLLKQQK